jgi:hypothetical protein
MSVTSNGKKVILGILALTLAAVVACGAAAPENGKKVILGILALTLAAVVACGAAAPDRRPWSSPNPSQRRRRWQPLHPSRRLPLLLLRRQQRRPLNWRRRPSQLRWLPPRQSFR